MSAIEGAESSGELLQQVDLPTLLTKIGRPNLPSYAAAPQHFLSHGSSTNWLVIARELQSVAKHEKAAEFISHRPLSSQQQRLAIFQVSVTCLLCLFDSDTIFDSDIWCKTCKNCCLNCISYSGLIYAVTLYCLQVEPLVLLSEILERRIRRSTNSFVTSLSLHHQHLQPCASLPESTSACSSVELTVSFDNDFRYI